MKRIKVKSFLEDVKKTGSIPAVREKMIENASAEDIPGSYPANILADTLHPKYFTLNVQKYEINETYIYAELTFPDKDKRFYFRNGQSLGIKYVCGENEAFFSLPVMSVSGEPVLRCAFFREYDEDAYKYFSGNAPEVISCVSFEGKMTYSGIRDKKNICIISDAVSLPNAASLSLGIKKDYPEAVVSLFYSADDDKFVNCVIGTAENIEINKLSFDQDVPGGENVTLFICGQKDFCEKALPHKAFSNVRIHCFDAVKEYESEKRYTVKVVFRGKLLEAECREGERLSAALLKAGIPLEIRCSDGECGYCRCRLLKGDVKSLSEASDRRQAADIKYGYIHPCSVTPVSDITVEL